MIRYLEPQPDGRLFVRTSTYQKDLPDGMVCRYEVHGPDGRLQECVEILAPEGMFDWDYDSIALLPGGRAVILRNLMPAFRAATDQSQHPDLLAKLPPPPDDRDDISFAPIFCELVPVSD